MCTNLLLRAVEEGDLTGQKARAKAVRSEQAGRESAALGRVGRETGGPLDAGSSANPSNRALDILTGRKRRAKTLLGQGGELRDRPSPAAAVPVRETLG